jgi:hypothetical protein
MNNEPVAWIDKVTGKPKMIGYIFADYDIPLYLHPAKTLTDEEIEVLASKHLCYQIEGSEVSGVFNFAKAILKKASEK